MNVKHLRKQLMAAIAMVVVAGVALSSATYAWFVSNNTVTAQTTNISAQSNSAYLVIQEKTETQTATDSTSTSAATAADTTAVKLYPAQVVNGTTDGTYKFESAYAAKASEALEKVSTRFTVGTDGSATEAVSNNYAHQDTFYIGTGGYDGTFSNLKVESVQVSAADPKKAELVNAMRVLIVCGDNWTVWKNNAEVTTVAKLNEGGNATTDTALTAKYADKASKSIASSVSKGNDVTVDIYVFYDGAEGEVNSDNLADLADCGVTVTFTATPTQPGNNS
ncbi:MAG: hypothetical protein SO181_03610 [Frisingicoccus sp.]|uniref:hypothetical protein n=1 Tax=Frisingicoccus sp. TaxID=1918627 RepID=UPI002A81AE8A|nr:hypothetical protein [Frisingicoccus sp.]MDY4834221.1 hypothetical protein [Frisingicoccus sp.]